MIENISGSMLRDMFVSAAASLEREKELLNALNVYPVPDGDTGTNMSLTMKSAVNGIIEDDNDNIKKIAESVSRASLMGARGNSGVILSQLIRGFMIVVGESEAINIKVLSEAFQKATETAYRAVMKPTEGTILTVARGCSDAAKGIERKESDIIAFMEHIIESGNAVLDKTPDMLPALKEANVVDAGGKGYMIMLEGMYSALKGEPLNSYSQKELPVIMFDNLDYNDSDIEFGYCTEFIINDTDANIEAFKKEVEPLGDSSLIVGDDNFIKVHIHTNDPGEVLKKATAIGQLIDIKIDNMRYQNENLGRDLKSEEDEGSEINGEFGIISVSTGEGLKNIFTELGTNKVLSGGQTMNPSTEDIINAIDSLKTENIFILPNNSNIILAANQAKEISEKNIKVIPTKSIPEGIAALIDIDYDLSFEENFNTMMEAYSKVKTGQVTFSVKDTVLNGESINEGDIIGLIGKEIVCKGKEIEGVTERLIDQMAEDGIDLLTIIYGDSVSEDEAMALINKVEDKYSDIDVETVYGGQPLYHYIIAAE